MGCGERSVTFIEQYQNTNQPRRSPQTQILLKASLSLYIFEDNAAGTKIIFMGQKSNDETRVKNP